jgi:sugar/nucleoside kinase (ribokinase family)
MGAKGCCIAIAGKAAFYPAYPKVPLDTTGAGDLFISGFLFGLLRGKPMAICAHYGALLGGAVVQYEGAEIPGVAWSELRKEILS